MRETGLQIPTPVQKGTETACGEGHGEPPCPSTAHAVSWWSTDPPSAHKGPYTRAGGCA